MYNIRVSGEAAGGIKDVTVQGLSNSGFIQKKNMIKKFAIIMSVVVATLSSQAATEKVNGINWTYIVSNDKASVGGGQYYSPAVSTSISGAITIPSTLGGYPVTSIGYCAFRDCSSLTNIEIPDSVTSIMGDAFKGCSSLTSIVIPDSVTNIGASAFVDCSSLTNIEIPDSVTSIMGGAFKGCSSLTSIVIPDNVTSIGASAFEDCSKLSSVKIPDSVKNIGSCAFSGCISLSDVTIGSEVVDFGVSVFSGLEELSDDIAFSVESYFISIGSIFSSGQSAFQGCNSIKNVKISQNTFALSYVFPDSYKAITNVVLAENTTNIGYSQFSGCESLKHITIPDSVTNIGSYAFSGCKSLRSVKIPNNVKEIRCASFSGCSLFTSVEIPDSVTRIGASVFSGCNSLTNIVLSKNITNISASAFYGCNSLAYVDIPRDVSIIGNSAFAYCSSLDEVVIPNNVTNIKKQAFANCSSLVKVSLSDSIEMIENGVFKDCTSLGNIKFPNNIESLRENAFCGCSSLKRVEFTNLDTEIEDTSFAECNSIVDVTICRSACSKTLAKTFPASYQSITNIVVLNGVTTIAAECFNECSKVKRIVIPASVTAIYDHAFKDCVALEEIVFWGDAPDVGSGILFGTPRSLKITVKEGSVGWNGGVSTELPEMWPVGDATARGITYYDESADVAAMMPVITPADGSIFADECEVSITCAAEGATIYYRTDGRTPKYTETYRYNGPFTITDTSTIVAVAVKDGSDPLKATATLTKRLLTLAGAAGAEDLQFSTGGSAEWMPIGDVTAPGGVSVKSGVIGDAESSWLEVSISGRGNLFFKRKVSCEDDPWAADWDHLAIVVDETEREDLRIDGETGWEEFRIDFEDNTVHTVRWVYQKDESDLEGEDCAWISAVVWSPADIAVDVGDGKSVVVPTEWLDKYESIVTAAGGDKAAALRRTAANGRKVWECFMLGLDPTKADDDFKITRFWMENGKPMFEFSHSVDGAGNSFVPRIKAKGKAKLTDSWSDVREGSNPAFRFFTAEVALP